MANSSGVVGVLRALLTADTGQFDTAMRKSVASAQFLESGMQALGKEAGKLTPQVERMVKSLGSDRLLSTANNLVLAVTKVGGASKLTEAQQKRVNSTVTEAIAKYAALGQSAPQAMRDLEIATRTVNPPTEQLTSRMTALSVAVGSFVGAFAFSAINRGAHALIEVALGAFEAANKIIDLSKQTGLSTKTIQQMQFVADKTNTTLESMTMAAFRLSANLAGGESSVAKAVTVLKKEFDGLTLADLQKLSQDEQWTRVVRALGRVQDEGTRNRLGIQLMGRSYAEVASAVAQNYEEMASAARISSQAQLDALNRQQERWESFKSNFISGMHSTEGSILIWIDAWRQMPQQMVNTGLSEWLATLRRLHGELEKGDIELQSHTAHLDLNADALAKASKAADELARRYAQLAELSARAFGLDKVTAARDMVEAIGGMSGLVLMDAEALKSLNKLMTEAIDAAERNGQLVPLEWLRIEDATRDNIGSLQEYLKLLGDVSKATADIPTPPELIPFKSELDQERMRKLLEANPPGSGIFKEAQKMGETIGHQMNVGIGRAFEQIPHFLTSSIIHSGNFINGLKAIGVDMADAIAEPLIRRLALRLGAWIGGTRAAQTVGKNVPWLIPGIPGLGGGSDKSPRPGPPVTQPAPKAPGIVPIPPGGPTAPGAPLPPRGPGLASLDRSSAWMLTASMPRPASFAMGGFIPPGVVQPAILHGGAFGEDISPRGSMAASGGGTYVNHWHISAIDADGVQRLVRSRDFVYEVRSIIKTNQHGLGSTIRRATGGTD